MDKKLIVINVVGLSKSLLGKYTPNINKLLQSGWSENLKGAFPAVTTTSQASMLTGKRPSEHGIVGNGWYFKDTCEVRFWLQSNHLIKGEKVWESIKKQNPDFSCSKLFWWYNMYSSADTSITPRPYYGADGSKKLGLYSYPADLEKQMQNKLGVFPLFNFWGPKADIRSSRWIVDCAIQEAKLNDPNLQLVYLPHLDYNLQRLGPNDPQINEDIKQIDHEVGRLIDLAKDRDAHVMIVSEYGIEEVNSSVSINKLLREKDWLKVRQGPYGETLDSGVSEVFAVVDHQIAHIYIKDKTMIKTVQDFLKGISGIEYVLSKEEKKQWNIDHERSGDLIVVSEQNYWFDYHYWLDDNNAPDFARTVDIHRKPGYDPLELFLDPSIKFPKLKMITKLIQKKLGFSTLMDFIPLDTSLVKGSHGRLPSKPEYGPIFISNIAKKDKEEFFINDIYFLIKEYFLEK